MMSTKTTSTTKLGSFMDAPPSYELVDRHPRPSKDTDTDTLDNPFSSVHRLSTSSSATINNLPPATPAKFLPTHHFQIDTPGRSVLSLPLLPRPPQIPIFSAATPSPNTPSYLSLRPLPGSGSSFLVSPSPSSDLHAPLSTTTYRFGPGRPPVVRLFRPSHLPQPTANPFDAPPSDDDLAATFAINSAGLFTRAVTFPCPAAAPGGAPGTFTWRYARQAERLALGFGKWDSVLVLEFVRTVFYSYPGMTTTKGGEAQIVALLVRNEEFRTPGTRRGDAGNGGRVMVDEGFFSGEGREVGVVMVLTTALVMLKREIDRSQTNKCFLIGGVLA